MYVNVTSNYTLVADPATWANQATETVYLVCNSTGGAITITLPEIADLLNAWNVKILVSDGAGTAATNNITIVAGDGNTINGAASVKINTTNGVANLAVQNATGWFLTAGTINPGQKSYRATLTQASTAAPTATVLGNNGIGTIVWARTSAGLYTGTLNGAFPAGKVGLLIQEKTGATAAAAQGFSIERTSDNVITVKSYTVDTNGNAVFADDLLAGNTVLVTVEP